MKLTWNHVVAACRKYEDNEENLSAWLWAAFEDRENILLYAKYFFPHYAQVESPKFHQELTDLLDSPGFSGIAAPRGHAKSTISTIIYLSWLCLYCKEPFILVGSETFSLATMNVNSLKSELETNERIHIVYGEQKSDYWKDGEFITTGDTMVMAISYGGRIRGLKHKQYRPTFILLDDMENDTNVRSADQRRYMREWLTKAVLPALAKGGRVKIIGTILHTDSLLSNIISGVDEFASWKNSSRLFKGLNVDADGNEWALWPAMYNVEELKRMRDDPTYIHYKGSLVFAQEIQNEPLSDLDRIIQMAWIDDYRFSLAQKMAEWEADNPDGAKEGKTWLSETIVEIQGGVDPAISEKTRADYWAMITVGFDRHGHQYILDIVRTKEGDIEKQAQIVIDSYLLWKHDKIKVEAVAYQAGLANLIKKKGAEQRVYPPIWAIVPDKDKSRRAMVNSASFSGGLVHLRTDHPNANIFREEILQFPRGTHDDMFDAYMNTTEDSIKKNKARIFTNKPAGF